MSQITTPILLGIADRAQRRSMYTDLLGVSIGAILPFYPQQLSSLILLIALPQTAFSASEKAKITVIDKKDPNRKAGVEITAKSSTISTDDDQRKLFHPASHSLCNPPSGFLQSAALGVANGTHALVPLPFPPLTVFEPGRIEVVWESGGTTISLGEIALGFIEQPPIGDEERRALLANPLCYRAAMFEMSCSRCSSKVQLYECIDNDPSLLEEIPSGSVRLSNAEDDWKCQCGEVVIDLRYLKRGVWYFFRSIAPASADSALDYVAPYHSHRLMGTVSKFRELIRSAKSEEELQKFLEQNDIFWSFLSPKRILLKPRVLTHHTADFGIVTASKQLILVEIEKPATKLTKSRGGRHSEVQAGLDQIDDWRKVVTDHKATLLSELNIPARDVAAIGFLLIAGANSDDAARIRNTLRQDTTLVTFEELAAHLTVVISQLSRM